jgi:hypothetical protein
MFAARLAIVASVTRQGQDLQYSRDQVNLILYYFGYFITRADGQNQAHSDSSIAVIAADGHPPNR